MNVYKLPDHGRTRQINRGWMIDKEARAFFNRIYYWSAEGWRHCGATLASANIPLALYIFCIYIISTVNYDSSLKSVIVDAFFHSEKFQRITVGASVRWSGNIKTQTAFLGSGFI